MAQLKVQTKIQKGHMALLYVLVFFSGFSALTYEIVWQRYLSILLGAQAKASVVVIAIFLGGMGMGYLQFGKWTRRFPFSLFLIYGAIEATLGIWALSFPALFQVTNRGVSGLYGILGLNSFLIDILSAIFLIGLPTFLMGGVLPVLTQAVAEAVGESAPDIGKYHSRLYGFNTIGAALGCAFTGFIFIPLLSFKGALFVGAVINILIALCVLCFFNSNAKRNIRFTETGVYKREWDRLTVSLLCLSFLSGYIITSLESVLLRVMGLATGSSNFNFTLLITSFIFCLGLAPLVARNLIGITTRHLIVNQLTGGFSLIVLYLSADHWSYAVHWIRITLRDSVPAFYLFQGLLGLALLGLMVIPLGSAGLTLPLCFQILSKEKKFHGHRVGQIYGTNALGSILGSLLGGYLIFYFFNADQVFKFSIFLTFVGAGLISLSGAESTPGTLTTRLRSFMIWAVISFGALLVFQVPLFHKERFLQPFRHPVPTEASYLGAKRFGEYLARTTRILTWKDGPNGSVAIGSSPGTGDESSRTLFVNGKSDGNSAGDFFTMAVLGHLTGLLPEQNNRVCIIGLGTGISASVTALYNEVRKIEVVEISETVVKELPQFDKYNGNFTSNPKAEIHQMDALKYLNGTRERFDSILSEPSNPWVVGVENLYSAEFYQLARQRLNPGGLFVQWIHSYSFNDDLMRMVLKTISTEFEHVSVFQLKGGDLALVAGTQAIGHSNFMKAKERMRASAVEPMLRAMQLTRLETLLGLEIIPAVVVRGMIEGIQTHHLDSPKLSNGAAQAFFSNSLARPQLDRRRSKHFLRAVSQSLLGAYLGSDNLSEASLEEMNAVYCGNGGLQNSSLCDEIRLMQLLAERRAGKREGMPPELNLAKRELAALTQVPAKTNRRFTAADLTDIYEAFEIYKKYASPLVRLSPNYFLSPLNHCLRTISPKETLYGECVLNKLLVMDNFRMDDAEFLHLAQVFMEWFRGVPETDPHLHKLEVAREALTNLLSEYR